MRKRLRISALETSRIAVEILDSNDTQALNLVRSMPSRVYNAKWEHWEVPISDENIKYIQEKFTQEEVEIDEEAQLVMKYITLRSAQADRKAARRWEYLFNGEVPSLPYTPVLESFKHQVVGLDALHNSEFFALFMEMGTGKSKVVCDEIRWCHQERVAKGDKVPMKILITAPKGVCHTWVSKELQKHMSDVPYKVWNMQLLPGAIDQLIEMAKDKSPVKVVVCSHDRAVILQEALKKFQWDLMVVDESARIKNPHINRSKAICDIGWNNAARRVILTGSPIVNSILDLFCQFHFMSPGCLGYDNWFQFKKRYTKVVGKDGSGRDITEYANADELKEKMARYSFMVKKEQCLDLPPKTYQMVEIEMGDHQRKMYMQMLEWFIASMSDDVSDASKTTEARAAIAQLTRLRQICGGFIKTQEGVYKPIPDGVGKKAQLVEDLEDISGKIIVWRAFQYDEVQIKQACQEAGVQWVDLVGSTPEHKRAENEDRFNNDDSVRVLIADAGCAGEGKTLLGTAANRCSTSIFWSSDFSLGKRLQAEDRNHRIGQDASHVLYRDYVCEDSIEYAIAACLQAKKDLANMMTDLRSIREILLNPMGVGS